MFKKSDLRQIIEFIDRNDVFALRISQPISLDCGVEESPFGVKGVFLEIIAQGSRAVIKYPLKGSFLDNSKAISSVLKYFCFSKKIFFVEDLHCVLRMCENPLSISICDSNVFDLYFFKIFNGILGSIEFSQESFSCFFEIVELASKEAVRFFYDHYVPFCQRMSFRERKPLCVYRNNVPYRNWIFYDFFSDKTNRIFAKGGSQSRWLFNPYVVPKKDRRSFLVAENKFKILKLDCVNAEMNVLASLSGDEKMKGFFSRKVDVYSLITRKIDSPDLPRELVKKILISYIYGGSPNQSALLLGVPLSVSNKAISIFKKNFPQANAFLKNIVDDFNEKKFIKIPSGRIFFNDGNDSSSVVNRVIQSCWADVNNCIISKILGSVLKSDFLFGIYDDYIFHVKDFLLEEESCFIKDIISKNPFSYEMGGLENLRVNVSISSNSFWQ